MALNFGMKTKVCTTRITYLKNWQTFVLNFLRALFFTAVIPPRCTYKTGTRKRKKSIEIDDLKEKIDTAYSMLVQSTVHRSTPPTSGERDVCDIYGELVAAKLKLMDENTRDFCMYRISNVFFKMKFPKDTLQ